MDTGKSSDWTGKAGSNVSRTGKRGILDRSGEVNRLRQPVVRVRNRLQQSHPCRRGGNVVFANSKRGTGETSGQKRTKKSDRHVDERKALRPHRSWLLGVSTKHLRVHGDVTVVPDRVETASRPDRSRTTARLDGRFTWNCDVGAADGERLYTAAGRRMRTAWPSTDGPRPTCSRAG